MGYYGQIGHVEGAKGRSFSTSLVHLNRQSKVKFEPIAIAFFVDE
jgi:hypothetical protein